MSRPVKSEMISVALTVADLERATRFYCEGLGFEEMQTLVIGNELAHMAGVEGEFRLLERFIRCGDTLINLLHAEIPRIAQTMSAPRAGTLGLSHIVVRVDDLENALARVVEFGGVVHEDSRSHHDNPGVGRTDIINCSDPDGNRIEMLTLPDSVKTWLETPKAAG